MGNRIGISASRNTRHAGRADDGNIIVVPDTRQPVAYLDLLGSTEWFRKNISDEDNIQNSESLRRYFEPFLATLWEWHRPEVRRMSVHPIGDGALIVAKENPTTDVPVDIQEFSGKLANLWVLLSRCGDGLLAPKILITRSMYHTIYLQKDGWEMGHDLYPNLVVPGGLATIKLAGTDKCLPVPSGIYSDLADYAVNRLAPVSKRFGLRRNWYALQIWDLGLRKCRPDALAVIETMEQQAAKYRAQKYLMNLFDWAAIRNVCAIRRSLAESKRLIAA